MKKKLTYAFGEILIVIIGITLAFWMNTYGENKKNEAQKSQYISSLIQDIETDRLQLQTNLEQIEKKIETASTFTPLLGTNNPQKNIMSRGVYEMAKLTSFTPKDFTYQALVNSGDLKLIDDLELKKAIEQHYSHYKTIMDAYKRQEIINKDYLGNYFIYNVDYDLAREGKSPFKDEKLLKNMMQAIRGSLMIKRDVTELGIQSCDSILQVLN